MSEASKAGAPSAVEQAKTALYEAPLSEFVSLRARLAGELRANGDKAGAKLVLALRKPNSVAWGLNQLARRAGDTLERLYRARAEAERAQAGGAVDAMRAAIGDFRARLDEAVVWVEQRLAEAGSSPTRDHVRAVRASLDAAAQDPAGYGAEVAAGFLVKERGGDDEDGLAVSSVPRDAFAVAAVPSASTQPVVVAPVAPAVESPVALAARRLEDGARQSLHEATGALRVAESEEVAARAEAARAEERLADASRALAHARAKVDLARRSLEAAEKKRR